MMFTLRHQRIILCVSAAGAVCLAEDVATTDDDAAAAAAVAVCQAMCLYYICHCASEML